MTRLVKHIGIYVYEMYIRVANSPVDYVLPFSCTG